MQLLFEQGKGLKSFPVKLVWHIENQEEHEIRVAFSAPKRSFKKAVTRNLIKRRLREAYRINKTLLVNAVNGKLLLMFVVQGTEVPSFQDLQEKIILLLQRLSDNLQSEQNG